MINFDKFVLKLIEVKWFLNGCGWRIVDWEKVFFNFFYYSFFFREEIYGLVVRDEGVLLLFMEFLILILCF